MGYKAPKEKVEKLVKASIEYRASEKSIGELENEFELPKNALRSYLIKEKLLKDEHKFKKTLLKENVSKAKELTNELQSEIQTLEKTLPAEVIENARESFNALNQKSEQLKALMIENAISINTRLKEMIPTLQSPYDLKEASATLKNLQDTAGLFPRAPMIAIQNNQNVLNQVQEKSGVKKPQSLSVNLNFIDNKSQE